MKRIQYIVFIGTTILSLFIAGLLYISRPAEISAQSTQLNLTSTSSANQDGTAFFGTATWIGNGASITDSYTGFRFSNVSIPKGVIITGANLTVTSSQAQWQDPNIDIYAENIANAPLFSSSNTLSQRTLTIQKVSSYDDTQWSANTPYSLGDISPVIQEIVNRSDWVSGNNIAVIFKGNGGAYARKFITTTATLDITYTTDGPTATPTSGPTPTGANTPTPTLTTVPGTSGSNWYMAGANPQRTSWVSENITGTLGIDWYRTIEAYIPQNAQIIAVDNVLYISSARGLYALNATNGSTIWQYNTEMPLGNSPTVVGDTVYVGSYDKRIHALDKTTGQRKWVFQALAGFNTNPVVVNNTVYAGSRDGYFYALNASTGQKVWQYPAAGQAPLGPIMYSAAYDNNVLYFASNDNHGYALNATTGALVWKTAKLPGESFQSWWPVVYTDNAPGGTGKTFVVFSTSHGYRGVINPGVGSAGGNDFTNGIERIDIFGVADQTSGISPSSVPIGPTTTSTSGPWPSGTTVMDGQKIIDHFEEKPWRRTTIYINAADGTEYTFDSDGDGKAEYPPVLHVGTKNGNIYPPVIRPAGNGYSGNIALQVNWLNSANGWIAQGQLMGWKPGTKYLSVLGFQTAVDEPEAISGGGGTMYRVLCCNRIGDRSPGNALWGYSSNLSGFSQLDEWIPDYNDLWLLRPNSANDAYYTGSFGSVFNSINGTYNNHGDQNPLIPHNGRVFIHRSNTIVAFGPTGGRVKVPTLTANTPSSDTISLPLDTALKSRLEQEVLTVIAAGVRLKPGYHNAGMISPVHENLYQYFQNPGELLAALSRAYPYLSSTAQSSLQTYLASYITEYFSPTAYSSIGWTGTSRNRMDFPPEVEAAMTQGKTPGFPAYNAYALWLYAKNIPGVNINSIYTIAKNNMPTSPSTTNPWDHNQWIAGFTGYQNLYTLAGSPGGDSKIGTIQSQLPTLLLSRATNFTKDSPLNCEVGDIRACRLNIARNFIYLTPELGSYLKDNATTKVNQAFTEYNTVNPYWFAAAFESTLYEGVVDVLHEQWLFPARTYLYKGTPEGSKESLYKYLDTPYFKIGDLFYMNNLIDVIEASSDSSTLQPGDVNGDGSVNLTDLATLLSNFGRPGTRDKGDVTGDGNVNLSDLSQVLSKFGT